MIITAEDLMLQFRKEAADPLEGFDVDNPDSECLWSNAEVYFYMAEAQGELARIARSLLYVTILPVLADVPTVALPRWVIDIRYARLLTADRELSERNLNETMSYSDDYGQSGISTSLFSDRGIPDHYIRDQKSGVMRLYPIPTENDNLELSVTALPRVPIESGADPLMFTELRDIRLILCWMKKLAYEKQDADAFDEEKSEKYGREFTTGALSRQSEMRRRYRRPATVRYGGL